MRRAILLAGLAAAAILASCGGDGGDPGDGATGASGVSDEQYLAVLCEGLSDYTDALLTATSAQAIADVITGYTAAMRALDPPADLREFHGQFVRYLEDAVAEPTSLVTRAPPKPDDGPRQRLAALESSVDACRYPTFLGMR
jgi:hypothetical protein